MDALSQWLAGICRLTNHYRFSSQRLRLRAWAFRRSPQCSFVPALVKAHTMSGPP
jgi:hypothetical protein